MKILATLCAALFSSLALANTYVKCGKAVNPETQEVTGYELELSSEGNDDYSGPVGKNWNLKLESENSPWLSANNNIVAKNYKKGGDVVVEISIKMAQSASGPVGTQYKLIGLYSETPVLEKYTMGGFAGSLKTGTFQCLSGND